MIVPNKEYPQATLDKMYRELCLIESNEQIVDPQQPLYAGPDGWSKYGGLPF